MEVRSAIDAALEQLAPRDRRILREFYLEEQGRHEICRDASLTDFIDSHFVHSQHFRPDGRELSFHRGLRRDIARGQFRPLLFGNSFA